MNSISYKNVLNQKFRIIITKVNISTIWNWLNEFSCHYIFLIFNTYNISYIIVKNLVCWNNKLNTRTSLFKPWNFFNILSWKQSRNNSIYFVKTTLSVNQIFRICIFCNHSFICWRTCSNRNRITILEPIYFNRVMNS